MIREDESWRTTRLAEIATQIKDAESELARAKERHSRVRRDYQNGEIDAHDWREQRRDLLGEIDAAEAALEQLRTRDREIGAEATIRGAEEEALAALAEIRAALAGAVTGAGSLEAARAALWRLFEGFVYHPVGVSRPVLEDGDLSFGTWCLEPIVRADAVLEPWVIGADEDGETAVLQAEQLRRVPVSTGSKPSSWRRPSVESTPTLEALFGPIAVALWP